MDITESLANSLFEQHTMDLRDSLLTIRETCESPIEFLAAMSIIYDARQHAGHKISHVIAGLNGVIKFCISNIDGIEITPQAEIGDYRVDFLVRLSRAWVGDRWVPFHKDADYSFVRYVVIECDGHDFHERTKAQASRDRARDRDLLIAGYQTLRYTGTDIHADAHRIVEGRETRIWADLAAIIEDYRKAADNAETRNGAERPAQ